MGRISWGTIALVLLLFFVGTGKISKAEDCGGDRFCSFQELNEVYEEGEDWEIEKRTDGDQRWLVSAIHGGGIEEATSTIGTAIAGSSYPYYAFKGRLSSGNFSNLHITSTRFDEPQALEMVGSAEHHIALHGASGTEPKTLLGGRNTELKAIVKNQLEARGFTVSAAPDRIDGDHPDNYTNRTKSGQGVQVEITRAQRKAFYKNGDISLSSRNDPSNQTEAFTTYVQAIQAAMQKYEGI
ncbi:poly-gamma-glutamate hydrolase family protein [Halobacillus sp. Marseille-P3879]|uniref:poly-gamma-glutamate hydrolase family protein n=1 Tax=Halobacillus sp. Marseille-P3879 TaxID=2045014 RepID=UPI000C7B29FC|nr:poly-gamma-glutamate hydrolase family protein [Halobacillus sp. Marseille-P3879]